MIRSRRPQDAGCTSQVAVRRSAVTVVESSGRPALCPWCCCPYADERKENQPHLARPLASTWLTQIAPAYDVICHPAPSIHPAFSIQDVKVPGHFTSHLTSPPSLLLPPARRRPRSSERPALSTGTEHTQPVQHVHAAPVSQPIDRYPITRGNQTHAVHLPEPVQSQFG